MTGTRFCKINYKLAATFLTWVFPTWRNIVWFVLKLLLQMLHMHTIMHIHSNIHAYSLSATLSPRCTYKVAVSRLQYENNISGLTPTGNWQKLVVLRKKYLTCHNSCDYCFSTWNISRAFRVSCESLRGNKYVTLRQLEDIAISVLMTKGWNRSQYLWCNDLFL